jgi:uncharacterized membrane protein YedE/YeeE
VTTLLELTVAVTVGAAFGAALERAGLGNSTKLLGQFRGTDFTVFQVMFTALLTAALGLFWLGVAGAIDLAAIQAPATSGNLLIGIWPTGQLLGGLVFGVGFAIAGLCPGTSCVAAASGKADGFAALVGIAAGMFATGMALSGSSQDGPIAPIQATSARIAQPVPSLPDLLSLDSGTTLLLLTTGAAAVFVLVGLLENRRAGRRPADADRQPLARRACLAIGLAAALGAAAHGGPRFVEPGDLARALRDRREAFDLVDARDAAAYAAGHVPGARRLAEGEEPRAADGGRPIVLTAGRWPGPLPRGARLLRGGYDGPGGWVDRILEPILPLDASRADRATWVDRAALSRYFGGSPTMATTLAEELAPRATAARFRRGC